MAVSKVYIPAGELVVLNESVNGTLVAVQATVIGEAILYASEVKLNNFSKEDIFTVSSLGVKASLEHNPYNLNMTGKYVYGYSSRGASIIREELTPEGYTINPLNSGGSSYIR